MTFEELCRLAPHERITESARDADGNSVFVCIRGVHADGHSFAGDAYRRGCRLFVSERALPLPPDAAVVTVPDTHTALAALACAHEGNPSRELAVIGVTGTKGKTTVSLLLAHILNRCGVRCGYIGSNGIDPGDGNTVAIPNTTPDAVTLQRALRDMVRSGCRAVALEVSSQALKLGRVAGTTFDTCIFTNLFPDHIGPGEHPDFADYAACKKRLFVDYPTQAVLCSIDDPFAATLLADTHAPIRLTCSMHKDADFTAREIVRFRDAQTLGCSFLLQEKGAAPVPCRLPLIGDENVSNALLAIACAAARFGIAPTAAAKTLPDVRISGRSETVGLPNGALGVIDYAHNGVSLRRLLTELRASCRGRLIVLFGSVGERTKLRRRELGAVAAELADLAVLTSDNPGTEDPAAIIRDVAAGMEGYPTPHLEIPDRAEAIRTAAGLLRPDDILVLAGKGHERYQLIGKEKRPFCEREILCGATVADRIP